MQAAGRSRPRLPLIERYKRRRGVQAFTRRTRQEIKSLGLASRQGGTSQVIRVSGGAGGGGGAGASAFLDLTDVLEATYVGQGLLVVRVNAAETGLEFAAISGGTADIVEIWAKSVGAF